MMAAAMIAAIDQHIHWDEDKSLSHCRNWVPFINSNLVGRNGAIEGSVLILGAKSDVVVIIPFDAF